jgi:hypothetical protein
MGSPKFGNPHTRTDAGLEQVIRLARNPVASTRHRESPKTFFSGLRQEVL